MVKVNMTKRGSRIRRVKLLVHAVQTLQFMLDDDDHFSERVVPQSAYDEYMRIDSIVEMWHIGSDDRKALAALYRKLRKNRHFKEAVRKYVKHYMQRAKRNPRRFPGCYDSATRRYPHTVEKAARPAKSHRDCAYCGCGGPGTHICGQCKEAGIDGPVIRGTEAVAAHTYITWRLKK